MRASTVFMVSLLCCLTLTLFTEAARAQVLSMPPAQPVRLPPPDLPPSTGTMVDGSSWLALRRFTDASGSPRTRGESGHNYHYDLGSDFVVWRGGALQVEGMVRMLILSTQPEGWSDNTWLLDLSALVVEQNLRVRRQVGPVGIGVGFHHNSKHDVDREIRRIPIHDTLRLELDTPVFRGVYGRSDTTGWQVWSRLRSEYALEPVFQVNVPENYAGGFALEIFGEPWIRSGRFAAFVDASSSLLLYQNDDGRRDADLDWLIRGGLRFGSTRRSVAVFADVQRLHDDWKTNASRGPGRSTEPWTLISVGVAFRR